MNPTAMELKEARSWNIVLPKEYGDEEEKAFCEDLPGNAKCTMMGHPSEGGFGFVALTATEAELEQILRKHPGSKRTFVEPDMPMAAIPDIDVHENGDTLLEFQDQSSRRRSGTTWGIDRIDSRSGTDGSYNGGGSNGGAGVHVYILDTGVRASHNDFGGRGVPTLDATTGSLTTCSASSTTCSRDNHGHGTHCGGTTSGSELGVAKKSIVHGCKVLSDQGSGYTSWITGSLDWVVTTGPKPAVASMSLGGPGTSSTYRNAIDAAVNAGVVVVVAAGNENSNACNFSPAFVPSAITVGATDSND